MDAESFVLAALQIAERATDPHHREAALLNLASMAEGEGEGEGAGGEGEPPAPDAG